MAIDIVTSWMAPIKLLPLVSPCCGCPCRRIVTGLCIRDIGVCEISMVPDAFLKWIISLVLFTITAVGYEYKTSRPLICKHEYGGTYEPKCCNIILKISFGRFELSISAWLCTQISPPPLRVSYCHTETTIFMSMHRIKNQLEQAQKCGTQRQLPPG